MALNLDGFPAPGNAVQDRLAIIGQLCSAYNHVTRTPIFAILTSLSPALLIVPGNGCGFAALRRCLLAPPSAVLRRTGLCVNSPASRARKVVEIKLELQNCWRPCHLPLFVMQNSAK